MKADSPVSLKVAGSSFANPVMLASGPAGYGIEYEGFIDLARLGAVVTKTVTWQPRRGNRGTRLHETPSGLLNSVGLENVGARSFFTEKLPVLTGKGIRVVVSLAAEDWDGYRRLLDSAAEEQSVDAVELNLSCPNVERGGMAVGTDPEILSMYVRHAKNVLSGRTIFAKLTPNVNDIGRLALAAEEAGADGITAINTVLGMDIDIERGRPVFDRVRAGLSGPAVLPVALEAVWRISAAVDIPVIGAGGIGSVDDARKFFMAGASGIQVGTAIFYDPGLPGRIIDWLESNGLPEPISAESRGGDGGCG